MSARPLHGLRAIAIGASAGDPNEETGNRCSIEVMYQENQVLRHTRARQVSE